MKIFRVVLTKSPTVGSIVDFAAADNAENSKLTHDDLLTLRQHHTPDAESLLPPLMLHDDNGDISVTFEKEEKATDEDHKVLADNMSRINASYNKLKYQGLENTLDFTRKAAHLQYRNHPKDSEINSPDDEKRKRDRDYAEELSRRHSKKRPPMTYYRTNGD